MTVSVLLDTSYLITLVDSSRANHNIAKEYYRLMIEEGIPMYFSSIVASEFGIRQPISDLPLKNFRFSVFGIHHGNESARLWAALGNRDPSDDRTAVKDDLKLLAQASCDDIGFILTEDASTLAKYCNRLRSSGSLRARSVILADGFKRDSFSDGGQRQLAGIED